MFKYLSFLLLLIAIIVAFGVFEHDIPAEHIDPKYTSPASQFLTLSSGARIHFRDEGPRDALPIVLLHGSNASLHTWEPWVAALGTEFRMVSLDLPGHGLTGRVPGDDYSPLAYVEVVHALARHLALPRFAIAGNSMGGGVAWRYALTHPDDVAALILVDASGLPEWREAGSGPPVGEDGDTPIAFALLRRGWFQSIARYLDPYYLIEQGLQSSYANQALVTEALIRRYYDLNMREGTRAATLARFGAAARAEEGDWDLASIRQPTLILWGDRDNLIPTTVADRFAAVIPQATLLIYENAGHIPMEEVPKHSAADVRTFLRPVARAG